MSVVEYKSISIFDQTISEIGNNFLLNEPIIEGKINPNDLKADVPAAVNGTVNNWAPVVQLSIVGATKPTSFQAIGVVLLPKNE